MRIIFQPVELPTELETWSKAPVMAAEAWVHGPVKPRHVLRDEEVPPINVGMDSLEKFGVKILEKVKVNKPEDALRLSPEADAYIIIGFSMYNEAILKAILALGKPVFPAWDRWGYAWAGRFLRDKLEKMGVWTFVPYGAEDVLAIIRALRGIKIVKKLRALYIGDVPSHSVFNACYNFNLIKRKLGSEFIRIPLNDFIKEINDVIEDVALEKADEWAKRFLVIQDRCKKLPKYARIYLALKNLMKKFDANAVTIDCAWLPDVEYVPCVAYSLLIDEGVPAGCEGDTNALLMMSLLMGISNQAVMMGNLNENATHEDLEKNIIVVNHDVLPPSMACKGCQYRIMDFHATGKGLTGFAELEKGALVTLANIHPDLNKMWVTVGKIAWTLDTTHCRVSVGVEVKNAKQVSRESFGHHVSLTYGDWSRELEIAASLLKMELIRF